MALSAAELNEGCPGVAASVARVASVVAVPCAGCLEPDTLPVPRM